MTRAAIAAALCLLAPAPAGAAGGRPAAALSASPSRVALAGDAQQTIRLTNPGAQRLVVDVARAGFSLDLHGRPRVLAAVSGGRSAASWLSVAPGRLTLAPGASAAFTVTSELPARAEPGDHDALVLLTTRAPGAGGVGVRLRLGVVVTVRAPGTIVRRLDVRRLQVRRGRRASTLELVLANRGNVTEQLARGRARVWLRRRGRTFAVLRPSPRDLLPGTRGVLQLRYASRARGNATAVVVLDGIRHTYDIRL